VDGGGAGAVGGFGDQVAVAVVVEVVDGAAAVWCAGVGGEVACWSVFVAGGDGSAGVGFVEVAEQILGSCGWAAAGAVAGWEYVHIAIDDYSRVREVVPSDLLTPTAHHPNCRSGNTEEYRGPVENVRSRSVHSQNEPDQDQKESNRH
jgi:hypothetical protein